MYMYMYVNQTIKAGTCGLKDFMAGGTPTQAAKEMA